MAIEVIAEHAGVTLLIHALERIKRARFLRFRLIRPSAEIRVSISAVMRIHKGGRYVLVQNLHRPEAYGPFGGVYKFHHDALNVLDSLSFRPEDVGAGVDMHNDLRGYIPRGQLHKFVKWLAQGDSREEAVECLKRELEEELSEIALGHRLKVPSRFELRRVRKVEEGPESVPGLPCQQYRVFDVYEPTGPPDMHPFLDKLFDIAATHRKLLVANAAEIVRGRAGDGRLLAHHCDYLIGHKRIHPDERPMAELRAHL